MILSAYQPYFAPFPGFFAKAHRSDCMVLMDSVQFPRGTTWLTRNRFKNDQGTLWMTIPVWKKGLGLQKINGVRISYDGHWPGKHRLSLATAYGRAPYFEEHQEFVEGIFKERFEKLIHLNVTIIRYLMKHLGISSRLVLLSELGIEGKEPGLSVAISRKLGASRFLAQAGARKYLDAEAFRKAGIRLIFLKFRPPVYPQLWGAFLPNLSAFDLLFNCGPKSRPILDEASGLAG
jgi:hypothetical protein